MSEVVVVVPREALSKYELLPWVEVVAAAERGDDGLTTAATSHTAKPDTAVLRGAHSRERSLQGCTMLYSRGW